MSNILKINGFGSGSGTLTKSELDPDPKYIIPDSQHCIVPLKRIFLSNFHTKNKQGEGESCVIGDVVSSI